MSKYDMTATCDHCGYVGDIYTYKPAVASYLEIECPKCQSTNNHFNDSYLQGMRQALKPWIPTGPRQP